jgi:hypothetical protein
MPDKALQETCHGCGYLCEHREGKSLNGFGIEDPFIKIEGQVDFLIFRGGEEVWKDGTRKKLKTGT